MELTTDRYLIRQKVFKLAGNSFHLYDEHQNLLGFSKQKAFKLREDIRVYTDESMQVETLRIAARKVIDFASTYDIYDPNPSGDGAAEERVGSVRRKGFSSLVRDSWMIFDADDQQIGQLQEDSQGLALARRFLPLIAMVAPQKFHIEVGGEPVCVISQTFNPLVTKAWVDFSPDVNRRFDRRLGMGLAILIVAIEGKQND